jgi:hypothetical protein
LNVGLAATTASVVQAATEVVVSPLAPPSP